MEGAGGLALGFAVPPPCRMLRLLVAGWSAVGPLTRAKRGRKMLKPHRTLCSLRALSVDLPPKSARPGAHSCDCLPRFAHLLSVEPRLGRAAPISAPPSALTWPSFSPL